MITATATATIAAIDAVDDAGNIVVAIGQYAISCAIAAAFANTPLCATTANTTGAANAVAVMTAQAEIATSFRLLLLLLLRLRALQYGLGDCVAVVDTAATAATSRW